MPSAIRFAIVSVLAGVCLAAAPAQDRWPSKVAFVDVERVVMEYKKTREITERLDRKIAKERQRIEARQAKLKESLSALRDEDDVDVLDEKLTLGRIKRERELVKERVAIEVEMSVMRANLEQRLAAHLRKVYSEVREQCRAIALEKGIQMVFLIRSGGLEEKNTKEQVMASILVRPVLFHAPELDLTNVVLDRLNQ